jgi:anti-sigma B factor antagonist
MNLSASVWVENRESLVHVAGELDLSTVGELTELLTGLIQAGAAHLVLDLAGVTFMDCTGLGVLLHARQASVVHGGGLLVVGVPARVRALLALTGTRALAAPDGPLRAS